MGDQIFSDGIGTITVIGATVRVDFVALSPTEREANGQPKAVFCQRIVMGVDGFLRSASKVQEAVQALQRMGAAPQLASFSEPVTRIEEANPVSAVTVAATPAAPAAPLQKTGTRPPFP